MKILTLKQLIKANEFTYVDDDITPAHFPPQGKVGTVELIDFKKRISTDNALKKLDAQGCRPATIYELLTWSQKNWNGKDLVIALGSVWQDADGSRLVACLYEYASKRNLDLRWFGNDWYGLGRFAVVRKSGSRTLEPSTLDKDLVTLTIPKYAVDGLRKVLV